VRDCCSCAYRSVRRAYSMLLANGVRASAYEPGAEVNVSHWLRYSLRTDDGSTVADWNACICLPISAVERHRRLGPPKQLVQKVGDEK
jgi:hypothetical protein